MPVRFQRNEIRGKLLCEEVSPEPPSRNSITLWLAGFLNEETGKPEDDRSFWRGVWGGTFFSKRCSPDYLLESAGVSVYRGACGPGQGKAGQNERTRQKGGQEKDRENSPGGCALHFFEADKDERELPEHSY